MVELTSSNFKKEVYQSDRTYFVMFRTTSCPACVQMHPVMDKVATNMKGVGIKVGVVNVDRYQEFGRMFNIHAVPKLLLFVPHKQPIEYQSERSPKAIGQFILSHQPGTAQVTVLNTDERLGSFFNATRTAPRIILFSPKTTVPPLFKHLCYQHRKGIRCGFASKSVSTMDKIVAHMKDIGEFDEKKVEYPSVYAYNRSATPAITHYDQKLKLGPLNDFFNSFDAVNQTTEEHFTTDKEEKQEKKKEPEKPKAEKKPARPLFSFDIVNKTNFENDCLQNKKWCLVFFFDHSAPKEQTKEATDYVEETLKYHYEKQGYTYLYTDPTSLSTLPQLKYLADTQPDIAQHRSGVLVLNAPKERIASWVPAPDEPATGAALWKMLPNFLDRLIGGEVRFSKHSFNQNGNGAKQNEL